MLLMGDEQRKALHDLATLAAAHPIDMLELKEKIKDPAYKHVHMARMTAQTVTIPFGYVVTFSIEENHPIGTCRYMSMSSEREGRVPTPEAVWMCALELGFWGNLKNLDGVWPEELLRDGVNKKTAINIVQRLNPPEGGQSVHRK